MPSDSRPIAPRSSLPLVLLLLPAPLIAFFLLDGPAARMANAWPQWLRTAALATTDMVQLVPSLILLCAALTVALVMKRRRWLEALLYSVASVLLASGFTHAVKPLVGRARPTIFEAEGLWGRRFFDGTFDYVSFPSGHATHAAALFAAIALAFPRLRMPCLLLAAWFGMTRIFIGVHHPSDVLAGWLVGLAAALLAARLASRMDLAFREQ